MAVTAMVQHRVTDYDAWRKAYDQFETTQKTGGVTHQSVYRSKDDPNNLLVTHGFATTADAAFVRHHSGGHAMGRGGHFGGEHRYAFHRGYGRGRHWAGGGWRGGYYGGYDSDGDSAPASKPSA